MNRNINLAYKGNYGKTRPISNIIGIVIHYTGNDGDTADNNAHYFQNPFIRKSSAHYFVDDDNITQSVQDNYIAWHCGTIGKYYHPYLRNANTIGIEMCDTVKNGVHDLSDATKQNTIELVRELVAKYNIKPENVVRHYDITHKMCPLYFVDETAWAQFKAEIFQTVALVQPTPSPVTGVQYSQHVHDLQWAINKDYPNFTALSEDGYYGPKTDARLKNVCVKKGSKGNLVAWVQCRVGAGIDGKAGNETRDKIIQFQLAHGLTPDGCAGHDTIVCILRCLGCNI